MAPHSRAVGVESRSTPRTQPVNGETRMVPGLLTSNSTLKSSSPQKFIVCLPCAEQVVGTGQKIINNMQYLTCKDFLTIGKAQSEANGNQAANVI